MNAYSRLGSDLRDSQTVDGGGTLELRTPGKGHWTVLVLAR
jgi:hypothetical protein